METTNNQEPRACPRDCRKCSFQQHAFCAAQLSFDAFGMMNGIFSQLEKMQEELDAVGKRMEELRKTEDFISPTSPKCPSSPFNPVQEAQEGSGAENRLPQLKNED